MSNRLYLGPNNFKTWKPITPFFRLETDNLKELKSKLDDTTVTKLSTLVNKTQCDKQSFSTALSLCIEPSLKEKYQEIIYDAAGVEPERVMQKLGWLDNTFAKSRVLNRVILKNA
jgi:hypothetical protein